jgi:hypothetical protein
MNNENVKFYNGCVVEVMGQVDSTQVCIKVIEDYRIVKTPYDFKDMTFVVLPSNLADFIPLKLPIGTPVYNKATGGFHGYVVGYEYESNTAVCRSRKISKYTNERTRYTYAEKELKIYDDNAVEFVAGKYYAWNNWTGKPSLAVEDPNNTENIMLVSHYGKVVCTVPKVTNKGYLMINFGMQHVKEKQYK